MSRDVGLLTLKSALGKNHCFFVVLGQHHEAKKQDHISLADLYTSFQHPVRHKVVFFLMGEVLTVVMEASLVVIVRRK